MLKKNCPYRLLVIEFYDAGHDRTFFFLTNNMKLSASTIAAIYKRKIGNRTVFQNA